MTVTRQVELPSLTALTLLRAVTSRSGPLTRKRRLDDMIRIRVYGCCTMGYSGSGTGVGYGENQLVSYRSSEGGTGNIEREG